LIFQKQAHQSRGDRGFTHTCIRADNVNSSAQYQDLSMCLHCHIKRRCAWQRKKREAPMNSNAKYLLPPVLFSQKLCYVINVLETENKKNPQIRNILSFIAIILPLPAVRFLIHTR
jgi:hypothetical protein